MGMADGAPSEPARPEGTLRSRSSGQSSMPSGNMAAPSHRSIRHRLKQAACLSPSTPTTRGDGHAARDAVSMKRAEAAFAIGSPNAPIGRHPCRRRNGAGEGNGTGEEGANWRGRTSGSCLECTRRDGARGRQEQGASSLPDRPGRSRQHRASAGATTALSASSAGEERVRLSRRGASHKRDNFARRNGSTVSAKTKHTVKDTVGIKALAVGATR